jgi:tetratricopeptide (TPR) repeat protein
MPGNKAKPGGSSVTIQVFLSYRRADTQHAAGRLEERLDERFKVFMDVDQIQGGALFPAVVRKAVDDADVLVAMIGQYWLTLTAENGGRRIDQPGDWVAEEIGIALRRGTPVIPVLLDGARMPSREELPPSLADLVNRQAMRIAHESFATDSERMIQTIEGLVSAKKPEPVNLWQDPDYPQARAAFLQELWPTAIEGFERVLQRHPRQPHVVDQLTEAKRRQQLLVLDATAKEAADVSRWQEAVEALTKIEELQPSDEVKKRLSQAQLRLRINELQNDIRGFAKAGTWAAVLAADAELNKLDPEASDPDGLATTARAELLEAELAASYALGVAQLDERDWTEAEATFRGLLDRRAGYRDAEALLALARRKGKPADKQKALSDHQDRKPVLSEATNPSRLVMYDPDHLPGKGGRQETPIVQRRDKYNSRLVPIIGIVVAVLVIIIAVVLVNNGDQSSTPTPLSTATATAPPPTPTATAAATTSAIARPEDFNRLISHLPAAVRSSCESEELDGAQLAEAWCSSPGIYRLFSSRASARSEVMYSGMKEGDCMRPPADGPGSYQNWAEHGMSGLLTCFKDDDGDYFVYWSIDQLGITYFNCCEPYQEMLRQAIRARNGVR